MCTAHCADILYIFTKLMCFPCFHVFPMFSCFYAFYISYHLSCALHVLVFTKLFMNCPMFLHVSLSSYMFSFMCACFHITMIKIYLKFCVPTKHFTMRRNLYSYVIMNQCKSLCSTTFKGLGPYLIFVTGTYHLQM